jgi:lysophospholipase L1-like esterase
MKNQLLLLSAVLLFSIALRAQTQSISWWNPATHEFPVIEGQAWTEGTETFYDRLPTKAKDVVREPVWNLSKHTAGMMIRFRSNAEEITVRYGVGGNQAMPHMPATGVSGVDLYAISSDGDWNWCRGGYSFGDTITYRFTGLKPNDSYHKWGREYRLYLPLYNSVSWMEIGVAEGTHFRPLPVRMEKPIVVYGTSIAQGACASRPGMAWTSILGRKLDRPLINLAFSGNGRLEDEVVALINEIDPKIFVLDCLPNLNSISLYPDDVLKEKVMKTVRSLKSEHPQTPILLVDHAGYTDGSVMPERESSYLRCNLVQQDAFADLKAEGIADLYYLSREEIALQLDDMVDGTHPNDLGMQHYADAYEKALRKILQEPTGKASTTLPIIQYREPDNYDWEDRHREILSLNEKDPPRSVIIANSIVHFWGGKPEAKIARESSSWEDHFMPAGLYNYAYGWDRIENVLWRVYHGELDGFQAENIFMMIGTNNLHLNTDDEILEGLQLLVKAIKARQPEARFVILGILPRRKYEERVAALNLRIAQMAGAENVEYGYLGNVFLNGDKKIDESLFSDGLHPNKAGYLKMSVPLQELLKKD